MYIIIGSVTTAMRFARILERKAGIAANVVHTPSGLHPGGCSYAVRIRPCGISAQHIRSLAAEYGVNLKGVYAEEFNRGERVWRAIP